MKYAIKVLIFLFFIQCVESCAASECGDKRTVFDFIKEGDFEAFKKNVTSFPGMYRLDRQDLEGNTPLNLMVKAGNADMVDFLLQRKNVKNFIHLANDGGINPLRFAVNKLVFLRKQTPVSAQSRGDTEVYKSIGQKLLAAGANELAVWNDEQQEVINEIKRPEISKRVSERIPVQPITELVLHYTGDIKPTGAQRAADIEWEKQRAALKKKAKKKDKGLSRKEPAPVASLDAD